MSIGYTIVQSIAAPRVVIVIEPSRIIRTAIPKGGGNSMIHMSGLGRRSFLQIAAEVGWGNAMRYILTGDHWSAADAYRMGEVQQVAPDAKEALGAGIRIANKIADCGPLGIATSLASAHLAIDHTDDAALSELDAQFGALFHTQDFLEGQKAESEGRKPVYQGK